MNPAINLVDQLLKQGRHLSKMGRLGEARRRLDQLLALPEVPDPIRIEAHQLLGDIHLDAQCYRRARRHLVTAIKLDANNAEAHYQLGEILDLDPDIDPKKAARSYRRALELVPDEARYWSAFGQSNLRLGREKQAYGAFVAAADLAPMDMAVIHEIVDGLCFLDREDDARSVLMAARFRLGHDSELEQLWERFRFLQVHQKQQTTKQREALEKGEAAILPFVPAKKTSSNTGEPVILRHDRKSRSTPHLLQMPDPKRAN